MSRDDFVIYGLRVMLTALVFTVGIILWYDYRDSALAYEHFMANTLFLVLAMLAISNLKRGNYK
jgi:hypothetical protein